MPIRASRGGGSFVGLLGAGGRGPYTLTYLVAAGGGGGSGTSGGSGGAGGLRNTTL